MAGLVDYEYVWAFKQTKEAIVHTNIGGKGERSLRIPLAKWNAALDELKRLAVDGLTSDVEAVSDGMGYFVSMCLDGKSNQLVAYGLPPEFFWEWRKGRPEWRTSRLNESTKKGIDLMLQLVPE